jgi:Bacterial Ig-like domain
MDLTRWSDRDDTELQELLGGDLELLEVGRRLRASRPEPRVDPMFQRQLRAQLMATAQRELRPRGLRQLLRPRPSLLAYGAAGMGATMMAVAALAYYAPHSDHLTLVQGVAKINEDHAVNPDDVITISFNQPMDHASVERGITIQPAVAYYPPTWRGNELIITPEHHLQSNSPYVVTIPRNAARDVRGDVPSKDIHVTFGTRPLTPVNPGIRPTAPAALVVHEAGQVVGAARLGFAGDGSLIATSGLLPATAPPAGASSTPGDGGAVVTPVPAAALVRFGPGGPVRLGDPVDAAALSPAGHSLATVTSSGGHAVVAVSDTDGSHRSVLSTAADPGSPVGWGGDVTHPVVLFLSGGQVTAVDLERHTHTVGTLHLDPGQTVSFAPGGRSAFVSAAPAGSLPASTPSTPALPFGAGTLLPGLQLPAGIGQAPAASSSGDAAATPFTVAAATGQIVDLSGSASSGPMELTGLGAGDTPAFSADGRHVAWIDRSGATPALVVAPLDGSAAPVHLPLSGLAADDTLGGLALDTAGDRVAYGIRHADGSGELRIARAMDGGVLATATVPQPSAPAFSPDGGTLGFLSRSGTRTTADFVTAPDAPAGGTSVPWAGAQTIDQLVTAEVAGDAQELGRLIVPASVETRLLSQLPGGLSRGYVISAVPAGDTVTAQIRLLRDPTNDHPTATFTDETVTLHRGANGYEVTQADIPLPLHDEPSGPQVIHVVSSTSRLTHVTTVRLTFDSDLDPASVSRSVIELGDGLAAPLPTVAYDATWRTLTVSFVGLSRQPLQLTVTIGLRDVNGQGLATPFTTQIVPG